MEKKFKKGDRVRFIGDDYIDQGVSYDEFTVTEDSDDKRTDVERYVYEEFRFSNDELELVESFDPKTAFLTELKELLTKYNVAIDSYGGDDGGHGVGFKIGDDIIWYSNDWIEQTGFDFPITPSNIFDYDK